MQVESTHEENQIKTVRPRGERGVEAAARAALANHVHFRGRVDQFVFVAFEEVLVVRGAVPSFFLKQMVQAVLKTVDGVRRVHNQLAVINSQGLSIVPRHDHRDDGLEKSPQTWADPSA